MYWEKLSSTDFDKVSKDIIIVINVASIEQHGPALPVETDSIIGKTILDKLNKEMDDQVLILPQLIYGCSKHHMSYNGTITLSHDTLKSLVKDIIYSTYKQGFNKFFILNSHGGNAAILQVICEEISIELEKLKIVNASWWNIAREEFLNIQEAGFLGAGHAGEFETSIIKKIYDKDFNSYGNFKVKRTMPQAEGDLLNSPKISFARNFKEMTENGIYGNPEVSSKEKGEKILEAIDVKLKEIILEFIRL